MDSVSEIEEAPMDTTAREPAATCTVFALIGTFVAILAMTYLHQPMMF